MREYIKNDKTVLTFTGVLLFFVIVLGNLLYNAYDTYVETVISQQQEHLQFIAGAVCGNLEAYLNQEKAEIEEMTSSARFRTEWTRCQFYGETQGLRQVAANQLANQTMLRAIYVLNQEQGIILRAEQEEIPEEWDIAVLEHALPYAEFGDTARVADHRYIMYLPINVNATEQFEGKVIGIIDLQRVFRELLEPVPVGKEGYLTVADGEGNVLMHPADKRIGSNYFLHMLLMDEYFKEQSQVRREQYSQITGVGKYKSRWWQSPASPRVTKINAYDRVWFGGRFWVVSAVMDAAEPLSLNDINFVKIALLFLVLLILLAVALLSFLQMYRNRRELQVETKNLKVLNRTLEDLNKSQAQVRHYQRLQTIGNFANGIAHEFNNLLTPILGLSELLMEELSDNGETGKDLETIYQAGLKAREITQQLLSFGRKRQERETYAVLPVEGVLQEALRMMRAVLPKSIELTLHFRHGDTYFFGSKTQLHQVILNLCSNAYQAMEQGGGVLTIETNLVNQRQMAYPPGETSSGRYIRIVISDTGCGMDAETLEQIFDPYFTTKATGQGTGLGLAVAQSIIANHDGYISAESILGKGSAFSMYLPEVPAGSVVAGEEVAMERPHKKASILVIDDAQEVAHTLARLLTKAGYEVQAFTNPLEAVAVFERAPKKYDIVITDYAMPFCNGDEVAKKLRHIRKDTPILLITGISGRELENMEDKLYAGILPKPLSFPDLCKKIEELLE